MVYGHYLERPAQLDPDRFARWAADVRAVLDLLPTGMIRGPGGVGEPKTDATGVTFNGPAHLTGDDRVRIAQFFREHGANRNADLLTRTWETAFVSPSDFTVLSTIEAQPRSGRKRHRLHIQWSLTSDAAIKAALILLAAHFPEVRVTSDDMMDDWRFGCTIAEQVSGRALPIPIARHVIEYFVPCDPEKFAAWSRDVAACVAKTNVPLAGPNGIGEPTVTPDRVAFNGVDGNAYDPFVITPEFEPDEERLRVEDLVFWRVQTLDKPYSEVVTAALILWKYYFWLEGPGALNTIGDYGAWQRSYDLIVRAIGVPLDLNIDASGFVTVE